MNCSQRKLFGLRYSDIENKDIGDEFQFKYSVNFISKSNIEIHEGFSFFDLNDMKVYYVTERINEIVQWLKADSENNRQKFGLNYDNTYSDFLCVKDNGKFFYPHELKKE